MMTKTGIDMAGMYRPCPGPLANYWLENAEADEPGLLLLEHKRRVAGGPGRIELYKCHERHRFGANGGRKMKRTASEWELVMGRPDNRAAKRADESGELTAWGAFGYVVLAWLTLALGGFAGSLIGCAAPF